MSGQIYTVTFTVGLIDKLAGIKKPEKAPSQGSKGPAGVAGGPLMHPEVIAMKQQDAQLARALARSKRVGDMLLKAEEEEAAQIKALGQELLQKYHVAARPRPCQAEEAACTDCYKSNPQDPLKCASLVDAYYECANKAHAAAATAGAARKRA